jgi:hypothetical protein
MKIEPVRSVTLTYYIASVMHQLKVNSILKILSL